MALKLKHLSSYQGFTVYRAKNKEKKHNSSFRGRLQLKLLKRRKKTTPERHEQGWMV